MSFPTAVVRLVRILGLTGTVWGLAVSCGLFRKPAGDRERNVRDVRAGRARFGQVAAVNPTRQFVVVRTAFGPLVDEGGLLVTRRGAERSARLVISPEKNRSHVTADIRDGAPEVGDLVFMVPSAESDEPGAPPSSVNFE